MNAPALHSITSAEEMIGAIRYFGIIPFFKGTVPGWSIEELTSPDYWFYSSEELGPWDWKVEAVREGDIAYGKFLGGKAAFATVEWYSLLMKWRRSIPKYGMALRRRYKAVTKSEKMLKALSPVALDAILGSGSIESKELRLICAANKPKFIPEVKKATVESVMQFLEMGTWTIVGDIQRVYRGANLEYKGWQRCSFTTPDDLFGIDDAPSRESKSDAQDIHVGTIDNDMPSWARMFEEETDTADTQDRLTPEEARQRIIDHVLTFIPGHEKTLEKII